MQIVRDALIAEVASVPPSRRVTGSVAARDLMRLARAFLRDRNAVYQFSSDPSGLEEVLSSLLPLTRRLVQRAIRGATQSGGVVDTPAQIAERNRVFESAAAMGLLKTELYTHFVEHGFPNKATSDAVDRAPGATATERLRVFLEMSEKLKDIAASTLVSMNFEGVRGEMRHFDHTIPTQPHPIIAFMDRFELRDRTYREGWMIRGHHQTLQGYLSLERADPLTSVAAISLGRSLGPAASSHLQKVMLAETAAVQFLAGEVTFAELRDGHGLHQANHILAKALRTAVDYELDHGWVGGTAINQERYRADDLESLRDSARAFIKVNDPDFPNENFRNSLLHLEAVLADILVMDAGFPMQTIEDDDPDLAVRTIEQGFLRLLDDTTNPLGAHTASTEYPTPRWRDPSILGGLWKEHIGDDANRPLTDDLRSKAVAHLLWYEVVSPDEASRAHGREVVERALQYNGEAATGLR